MGGVDIAEYMRRNGGVPPRASDAKPMGAPAPQAEPKVEPTTASDVPAYEAAWLRPTADWITATPPARNYLFTLDGRGYLPLGKPGLVISAGGLGKSQYGIGLGVAVAGAVPPFGGCGLRVEHPGKALLILGEEDGEEAQRRIHHAVHVSGADPRLVAENLIVLPLAGIPATLLSVDGLGNRISSPFSEWLKRQLGSVSEIRFMWLDPIARLAGPEAETRADVGTRFVQEVEAIAAPTGASILCAHHTNKSSRADGTATSDASASRGTSAFTDGSRWTANLSLLNPTITDPEAALRLRHTIQLRRTKTNYTGQDTRPILLRPDATREGALRALDAFDLEELEGSEAPKGGLDEAVERILVYLASVGGTYQGAGGGLIERIHLNRQRGYMAIKELKTSGRIRETGAGISLVDPEGT